MEKASRRLLEKLNEHGEMRAQEFLQHVERSRNDYADFYMAANLMHAGYFDLDAGTDDPGNSFGANTRETAIQFCQLMLPEGGSFKIYGCSRESWSRMEVTVFSTAKGFLKLQQLREQERHERREDRKTRQGYWVAVLVAVLAATLSGWASSYFTN
jgi:hypothetical protein